MPLIQEKLNKEIEWLEKSGGGIISLYDNEFIEGADKFNWTKDIDKPILGICAGMQTISLLFDEPLVRCLQIGMAEISALEENPLFQGNFKAYVLHNYSVKQSQTFEVLAESTKCIEAIKHKQKNIFGVLFHPEVRNQEILRNFIQFGL